MSFTNDVRNQFKHDLADLKKVRDEVRSKLHNAGAAAQEKWRELEPKIEEVERRIETGSDELLGSTNKLFEEVGRAFRDFSSRLVTRNGRTGDGDDSDSDAK